MTISRWFRDPINRNYLYSFLKNFSFFSAVLVPFFTDWGHLTLFQTQLIQSWFSLWVFILEVPTGALADKIGRKHSISLGSFIVGIAVIIYGLTHSFGVFLLSEFLFAIGYAFISGADQALLYDTIKSEGRESESKKIMGRSESLYLLGMLLAAPIGSFIAAKLGLNAPLLFSAIPLFLAASVAWSIPEPRLHSEGSESPKYMDIVRGGLRTIRHNKVVLTLAIDSVLVASSAYFVVWFYQPLLTLVQIPLVFFGLAHSLLLGTEMIISANFTFLEKFLGEGKSYIRNTAILVSLSIFLVAIYPTTVTVLLFIIIAGGIGLTRGTYIVALASKHIESRERATVLSSIAMIRRMSLVILNPIIGYIATGSLSLALIILSLIPLGTLFIKEEIE